MLRKLLIDSYTVLVELALWLMFIVALVAGYQVGGGIGAIIGLIIAFLFSVLIIAPFLLIADIREIVKRIEKG